VLAFDCVDKNTTTLRIGPNWIQAGEMVIVGRAAIGGVPILA
jgi:hypothetical protein